MKRILISILALVAVLCIAQTGLRNPQFVAGLQSTDTGGSLPHSLTTNLVAFYKLDEASGNRLDSSGNGYTLAESGTINQEGGVTNSGAGNTGTTGRLTNNVASTLMGAGDFSVSWWQQSTNTACYAMLSGLNTTSGNFNYYVRYTTPTNLRFVIGAAVSLNWTIPAITNTTPLHIALVWTEVNTNLTVYTNGTLLSSNTFSTAITRTQSSQYILGIHSATSATALGGWMDEVGFWTRAITPTEVTNLYNKWRP